jgi:hypothetical protein
MFFTDFQMMRKRCPLSSQSGADNDIPGFIKVIWPWSELIVVDTFLIRPS